MDTMDVRNDPWQGPTLKLFVQKIVGHLLKFYYPYLKIDRFSVAFYRVIVPLIILQDSFVRIVNFDINF